MTLRRLLQILCLAAIVVSAVSSHLLQLPFIDRGPAARELARYPDHFWPDYPLFLTGVREHTKPGDTIAIIVPRMSWEGGYSYAYYRASYFLTGREVLPLLTRDNVRLQQNFRAAKYIAVFGVGLRAPADVVWRGGRGALLRLRQ
ncbi:MAG TPA: hypothetical protein VII75_15745 [Thermoanaerobaculia bacterium]